MMRTRRPLLPLLVCRSIRGRSNFPVLYSACESLLRSDPAKSTILLPPVVLLAGAPAEFRLPDACDCASTDQSPASDVSTPPRVDCAFRELETPPSPTLP